MRWLLLGFAFSCTLSLSNCYGHDFVGDVKFNGHEYIKRLAKVNACAWKDEVFSIYPKPAYATFCLLLAAAAVSTGSTIKCIKEDNNEAVRAIGCFTAFAALISTLFTCLEGIRLHNAIKQKAQYVDNPMLTFTPDYLEKVTIGPSGTQDVTKIPWEDITAITHNVYEKNGTVTSESLTIDYRSYTNNKFISINETSLLPVSPFDIAQIMMYYTQLIPKK